MIAATPKATPTPKSIATRRRILATTQACLLDTAGAVEMQAIARQAEVVPSLVSHHFGSKSGLISAVVQEFFADLHREVLDVDLRELGDWYAREHARTVLGVDFYYEQPLTPIIYQLLERDSTVAGLEADRIAGVVAASARNIAAAQRAGELPAGVDPTLAGAGIFGALRLVIVTALTTDPSPSRADVVDQLWRMTVAAVHPDVHPDVPR
ncbi:putative TetR family transcriptional regulator [Gordonia hirsuta DSM 44140 = NBRC 16056]|uniref:Putative TetR family transcriptional regulator n=1 Tax=Gordonia hirsuta DSM 44140 = NBRC 16056 TaxID=1121927 RepID=L7LF50_9ACTN|nr:TetR/AcrR family transcriptional regulator [Gordonia hirsuta]GAC58707.1 putative TetR family transcriptional regulator [Gordonia hirsuta DSM 44140 = NBRC 16056]